MAYARPVLCRLCGFPAPDGGVPASEVDRGKLSEWCLRMMDTDLDQEGLEKAVFCNFCCWQARFLQENHDLSKESRLPIWWKRRDSFKRANYDYKYFLDELIRPCAVSIPLMSKGFLQRHGLFADGGTLRIQGRGPRVISNCIYCSTLFESKKALVRHVEAEHQNVLTFQCFKCKLFFLSSREKKSHMEKFHSRAPLKLKCLFCLEQLTSKYSLAYHMRRQHKVETFYCKHRCGASFTDKKLRKQHTEEEHEGAGKLSCIYCAEEFPQVMLTSHVKTCHESIYIKCDFCTTFFHTKEEKERHTLEMQHESGFGRVECIYCLKSYARSAIHNHMMQIHHKIKIRCRYLFCTTYFHTQEEEQRHLLEMHESNMYKCIYCNLVVKNNPDNVHNHMKRHHKTEAIRCDYLYHCRNYFPTQEEKQKHILEVHESGEDKIRCKFCLKMVPIQGMVSHISFHHRSESKGLGAEDKKVECIYCMKKINKLGVHIKHVHQTEAIRCNFNKRCSTFFLTLEDRQKHIKEVHLTGNKFDVFKCCFCTKVCTWAVLYNHVRRKHPEAIKCKSVGCREYFRSKRKQQDHYEEVHAPAEKGKTFQCTHCKFVSTSRQDWETHYAQEHKRATVQCPKCPKKLKSESALSDHLRGSHGATQKCPHCLGVVKKRSWAQHLQATSCLTCKAALPCRGFRSKHNQKWQKCSLAN